MQTNFATIRQIFEDIVDRPTAQWDSLLDQALAWATPSFVARIAQQLLKCHVHRFERHP